MYVNMIRERAGMSAFNTLTEDLLLEERGREVAFEAWRRQDLIRFGRYNDTWWEKPVSEAYKNIFPIPRSAQNSSNPNLVQNPGY